MFALPYRNPWFWLLVLAALLAGEHLPEILTGGL